MNNVNRHSAGIASEIRRLSELKAMYDRRYEKGKYRIDYLMKAFQIEKLDTELNKLSFRSSSSVEVVDETTLPAEYFRIVPESKSVDKIAIKQAFKEGKEVP
jgi:hypothetical protein